MGLPLIVNTTGLLIVVSGVNVGDVELKCPNECDDVGVIEGLGDGVEKGTELVELLWLGSGLVVGDAVEGV